MRNVQVPQWLTSMPYAPEFRPTDTEFADPIAYISKIEKEASVFGICKIIPPLARPAKKYVFSNLNLSLVKAPELGSDGIRKVNDGESRAVFTTRQQELGKSDRKVGTGMSKQVWQSGEVYTLDQFESKAKAFSRTVLGGVKDVSPLVTEALFWKVDTEKAMYIEYANDVPGSGFGEPSVNGSFQYFHKRRKRVFRRTHEMTQNKYGVSDGKGSDRLEVENSDSCKISIAADEVKTHVEAPSISSDRHTRVHQQGISADITEVEGTAGWKLSNCPWNLQVIARSPGSLTRFMPDDIPGVTSPMVYIGMLFSWFAWHIEDHELHSLNFLHTGSSKTWYSVPCDYAFAFEELIRTHAYGENVDRLAALMMLGEKTTLLSPEVVVASDIPCCRLVQNPGEFVVTFPRAYHVGFSHGFNCGEAANFGTPQWLQVAKEAAVRRAAMDFLPMLSHQQLLYLLTMSFVNRVPRALLVGARSSRLRDRAKRERELSVKNAFIEDLVNENKHLSVLCRSTYRAVIWDPESLPSLNKEISPLSILECNMPSIEESNNTHLEQGNKNLLDEMCLYMETMKDQYVDDDSFLSDFQVDYGTVACVACGVLGFPFMTVVQPSEKASLDIRLSVQFNEVVKEGSGQDDSVDHSISALDTPVVSSTVKFNKEWNTSDRFLRPRVFCLEHAIQVNELLEAKGGANVLVICHSDFQKIKNHAASIAVELGSKFKFDMVPLDNASKEDLNLIDHAIDEDIEKSGEDWSSILGVNLRSCVKMRKNSSSKHVDHALGLFSVPSELNSCSSFPHLKWKHTRSRSKTQVLLDSKLSSNDLNSRIERENKIVQYKRRKAKPKPLHPEPVKSASETSAVISSDIDNFVASVSGLDISVNLNENSNFSPTSMDQNLEQKFSVRSVCGPTCDNAIVDDSEIVDAGDMSLIETGLGVIDVPCIEKIMYIASVDELGDKTIDVQITGVAPVGVSVEDDSSCQVPITQSPDVDDGTKEPAHDQSIVTSKKMVDANPGFSPSKSRDLENNGDKIIEQMFSGTQSRKRNRELEQLRDIKNEVGDFVRSPCEGLRQRRKIVSAYNETNASSSDAEETASFKKKSREMLPSTSTSQMVKTEKHLSKGLQGCDLEGCVLSFKAKAELALHRKNQCHIQGCHKKFTCHRYLIVHQRVHAEDRPLKCSWKGCNMSFKWAWARTEHLRVHTGEQPYKCKADDCGKRFRFISDFSRHRRKTGHAC